MKKIEVKSPEELEGVVEAGDLICLEQKLSNGRFLAYLVLSCDDHEKILNVLHSKGMNSFWIIPLHFNFYHVTVYKR